MHASQGHHAVSLDASSSLGDADEPAPLGDRIGADDLGFDTVEYGAAIEPDAARRSPSATAWSSISASSRT